MPDAITNAITDVYKVPEDWRSLSDYKPERKVGGDMGKHDFLMLLSAQLRYQDPLEPLKDSDFAAQLAQFSALEQMENMNQTLAAMSSYQAYGLVGKFAVATAYVDGVLSEIPGVIDCVFTKDGVTFAQIGDYAVPISAITDVYDNSNSLTPQMLIETSNNLIGRIVKAQVDKLVIEGVVSGVYVDGGNLWARIVDGTTGKTHHVQVGCIYDIRQQGLVEEPEEPEEPDEEDDFSLEAALAEAEEMYVGQTVIVQTGDEQIEGEVTRVETDEGVVYAYIDTGSGDELRVPVESIAIKQTENTPEETEDPDDNENPVDP